jgi:hypothetical protein
MMLSEEKMNPEHQQAILSLREKQLTPKQIARKLGLKVSEVSGFLKEQAEQVAIARAESGELPPLVECLVNKDCIPRLFPDKPGFEMDSERDPGFAIVTVTRSLGVNRLIASTYLVDYWCLGVKDASGPRKYNRGEYEKISRLYYEPFIGGSYPISLQEAQAIVWGGIDYAQKLGFKPHPDFEAAKALLGDWDGELKPEFGKDGEPFYVSGPHDDSTAIIKTLNQSLGARNNDDLVGGASE